MELKENIKNDILNDFYVHKNGIKDLSKKYNVSPRRISKIIHKYPKNNLNKKNKVKEEWKVIDLFDGKYSVSNKGLVKSNFNYSTVKKGEKIHQEISMNIYQGTNYPYVELRGLNNKRKKYLIHRLVAEYFIENPKNLGYVNHIDGDKTNYDVNNLEWVSASYNISCSKFTNKVRKKGILIDVTGDEKEDWAIIKEYPNWEISSLGRIRKSVNSIYTYSTIQLRDGYHTITVFDSGNINFTTKRIHRLVAECFIPNPLNLPIVNHKDGAKTNNRIENLEWISYKDNAIHAIKNKLQKIPQGQDRGNSKLKDSDVVEIRKRAKNGESSRLIAKDYNINARTIRGIISRERWKHIK